MVSRQRAYNLTFENKIRNLTKAAQYDQFFQAAEPPSYKFMQDQAKHVGIMSLRHSVLPDAISGQLNASIGPNKACILGFFGGAGGTRLL